MRAKSSLTFVVALTALAVFAAVTLLPAAPGGASPGAFVTPVSWSYLPMAIRPLPSPTPTPTSTPSPTPTQSPGWVTIKFETFEGDFPNEWIVFDGSDYAGEYYWERRNCRASAGFHSSWAVGGGVNGSTLPCGSSYPNYAESAMGLGPFSLADASAGDLNFKVWLNSEYEYDYFFILLFTDPNNPGGYYGTGTTQGWINVGVNLADVPGIGSVIGQPEVFLMFAFISDGIVTLAEGAYVDEISLRKYVAGAVPEFASLTTSSRTITRDSLEFAPMNDRSGTLVELAKSLITRSAANQPTSITP